MDLERVSEQWGASEPELLEAYYGFPPLRDYLHRCITGEPSTGALERDWLERWTVDTFLRDVVPVDECLSLCCGFGELERLLAALGVFRHCTGIDVATGAIEAARRKAAEAGLTEIDYVCADIDSIRLERHRYDLVWANGAFHHLTQLEHVAHEVYEALKPGGILVANEYVGPAHQRLGHRQLELINAVVHLIPPSLRHASEATFVPPWARGRRYVLPLFVRWARLRASLMRSRSFRFGRVWDVDRRYFERTDPSEGVRSDEIVPILRDTFDEIKLMSYNGSLLAYALERRFFRAFDPQKAEHTRLLELLESIERSLIELGELESDHAHIVAWKKRD